MAKDITTIKEGDQVKLISGGSAMRVTKVLINTCSNTSGAVVCEVWDAEANKYVIKDYKPEDLTINELPNVAY